MIGVEGNAFLELKKHELADETLSRNHAHGKHDFTGCPKLTCSRHSRPGLAKPNRC